jgi:hypothetical protein
MDGPYCLRLISRDLSTYRLECLDCSNNPVVVTGADVDAFQFRSEILRAAADVSGACERHDWVSPDLTLLRSLLAQDEAERKLH